MPMQGFSYYLRRNGGIWHLRIGVWQFSFCRCRERAQRPSPRRLLLAQQMQLLLTAE